MQKKRKRINLSISISQLGFAFLKCGQQHKLNNQFLLFASISFFCLGNIFSCQFAVEDEVVISLNEEPIITLEDSLVSIISESVPDDACNSIQEKVKSIQFQENFYEHYRLNHMFLPGGSVQGFYKNEELVWIKTYHSGELGGSGMDFYLEGEHIIAVHQYRDGYKEIDHAHWDYKDKTLIVDRTIYFYQGDSICSEVITEHEKLKTGKNGLHSVNSALQDFKPIKEELDANRVHG